MPDDDLERPDRWFGSLGSVIQLLLLTWAAGIASFPINDNSFFTHLATGRIILEDWSVPSADPYTFTAAGEPWTVQSWLASLAYAGAEQLGGAVGVRILVLIVFLVAMSVLWALSAPATSLIGRVLVVTGGLFVVTDLWSERPYMVGVVGLGVVWLALDGRVRPWVLLPSMWLWVNAHGSFPLAVALVAAVAFGSWLDARRTGVRWDPSVERAVARWTMFGFVAAIVNPVGPRLLLFPLKALTQSAVLADIVEWNPPQFDSVAERTFLMLFLASVAAVGRLGRWRLTVPLVLFGGAALYAQRNVVMAVVVCIPILAAAVPERGALRVTSRPTIGPAMTALTGVLFVLVAVVAVGAPFTGLGGYPARALAAPEHVVPLGGRLAAEDFTGNLLEALDGPTGEVYVDDRADMFPADVFGDYVALVNGEPEWEVILDRYGIDRVIWTRGRPLASFVAASPAWRVTYSDTQWLAACRRERC